MYNSIHATVKLKYNLISCHQENHPNLLTKIPETLLYANMQIYQPKIVKTAYA
jgi:hypothetical protein